MDEIHFLYLSKLIIWPSTLSVVKCFYCSLGLSEWQKASASLFIWGQSLWSPRPYILPLISLVSHKLVLLLRPLPVKHLQSPFIPYFAMLEEPLSVSFKKNECGGLSWIPLFSSYSRCSLSHMWNSKKCLVWCLSFQ